MTPNQQDGRIRKNIHTGFFVEIVQKHHQRSGELTEGTVKRNNPIRVLRDNVVIYEGELESLRRHKDDVSEVKSGTECGIGVRTIMVSKKETR